MKSRSFIWQALVALNFFYLNPAVAATTAGVIQLVEGDVTITRGDNTVLEPIVGDSVEEGDSIVTGNNGELHVVMADGGFIALRANTRIKIEQYRADGDKDDKSVISLIAGTFRSITGWIGKYSQNHYRITSPTGTIGIRGTDHEPLYIPESARGAEGEAGLYDKVNQGETFIQNPQGKISIKANQAGFVPYQRRIAPKLLPSVPKFFRVTRNEQAIDRQREILKPQIEKRRLEKRRFVQQERAAERKKTLQEKRQRRESPPMRDQRRLERGGQFNRNETDTGRFATEGIKRNRSGQRRADLQEDHRDENRSARIDGGSHGSRRHQ